MFSSSQSWRYSGRMARANQISASSAPRFFSQREWFVRPSMAESPLICGGLQAYVMRLQGAASGEFSVDWSMP
jgi:hypothetical protein